MPLITYNIKEGVTQFDNIERFCIPTPKIMFILLYTNEFESLAFKYRESLTIGTSYHWRHFQDGEKSFIVIFDE